MIRRSHTYVYCQDKIHRRGLPRKATAVSFRYWYVLHDDTKMFAAIRTRPEEIFQKANDDYSKRNVRFLIIDFVRAYNIARIRKRTSS